MKRNVNNVEDQLRLDEGEKLHAYQDHLGYWTIGIGHLIDKRKGGGITPEISRIIFQHDLREVRKGLTRALPWFPRLDLARQGVLVNMAFQMGVGGLLKFRDTLAHVEAGDYREASAEMLNSKWARQTPERAQRLSIQMQSGVWQ